MGGKRVVTKNNKKRNNSKLRVFGRVLLIIALVLVVVLGIAAGVGAWYVGDKLGKVNYVDINEDNIEVNEQVEEKLVGYRTIAIFGVDSRSNKLETATRSDCIILATDRKSVV